MNDYTTSQALGFVELPNLCDAINVLDDMLKAAAVQFVTWEKRLGGRLVTIIIEGSVGNVHAAIDAAKQSSGVVDALILPVPHAETIKIVGRSVKKNRMSQ